MPKTDITNDGTSSDTPNATGTSTEDQPLDPTTLKIEEEEPSEPIAESDDPPADPSSY